MTDLLGIGAAGVRAYRTALGVVGDNVANADSAGYVRRTVTLRAAPNAGAGSPLTRDVTNGSGVDAGTATRAYDALTAKAARNAGSDVARLTARGDWLTRLQGVLGGDGAQLNGALGNFWDGLHELSATPLSTAARAIALDRADQAATAFRDAATGLTTLAGDLADTTATATREVNALTGALARVNVELTRAQGGAANALLDERDRLLGSLGTYLRVGVVEGRGGTVTVTLGDGPNAPALVQGDTAVRIGVRDGANGAELVLAPEHEARSVRLPASGSLAGLLEAARAVARASTDLDALATRFGDDVNRVQALGVDASGADGQALFVTRTLAVTPGAANAGTATVEVAIADAAPLDPAGYTLRRAAGAWTLARADASGAVSGAGPLSLDGVTMSASSGARDGDVFVAVTTGGAAGLALRPVGATALAVSARWLGNAAASNAGTGRLALATDPAASALPALPAYSVRITGPATADIADPATGTVLASATLDGTSITGAGFAFTIDGTPAAGDNFRIARAGVSSADTGNLGALLALRASGGVEDGLDATVAGIASRLSETTRLADAASAVQADAARANDAVGGVDLDREAAELSRLQAAYKANAQVIAAARELFDALLQVAR